MWRPARGLLATRRHSNQQAHARDVLRVFGQPPPVARAVLGAHESERPATALGHVIDVKPLAVDDLVQVGA